MADGSLAVPLLEICVDHPAGVVAAIAGGADRIELCSALELGGLTPGVALAAMAVDRGRAAGVPVHAMVRPRAGDFAYADDELAMAVADAVALAGQGVDGLVFGAARGGVIDVEAARRWVGDVRARIGRPVALVFHRAIDLVDDPVAAVETVAALGFGHILTSGGARVAADAMATIAAMHRRAGDATQIIAGSGVRPDTVGALLAATGVRAVHASASVAAGGDDPRSIAMGFALAPRRRTDTAIVAALKKALDNKSNVRQ